MSSETTQNDTNETQVEDWAGPRYFSVLGRLRALTVITGRLAEIVLSRAPLTDGLLVDATSTPSPRLRSIFLSLRTDLVAGMKLSESMQRHNRIFPAYYIDMVKTGETTGKLYECLMDLETALIAEANTQSHARFNMLYASSIILIAFAFAGSASHYLQDTLQEATQDTGFSTLNVSKPLVFRIADLRLDIWAIALLVLLPFIFLGAGAGTRKKGGIVSYFSGVIGAFVPPIRYIFVRANLGNAFGILGKLIKAGMPLQDALGSIAESDIHPFYRDVFKKAKERVEAGASLGDALAPSYILVPTPLRGLIALGEKSGRITETLTNLNEMLQREAVTRAKFLVDIIAPVGILAAGIIVFSISSSTFATLSSMHMQAGR
jgi:type II secretory pathway component PulF